MNLVSKMWGCHRARQWDCYAADRSTAMPITVASCIVSVRTELTFRCINRQ